MLCYQRDLREFKNDQKKIEYTNLPKFKPLICYESIFPGKFIKDINETILIVNFTNDAWFGDTIVPHQHFINTKFRTIEEGKH